MKDVKDKRILVKGLAFNAEVHWYDGTVTSAGLHATLKAAQKALSRYPDDVWAGYDEPCGEKSLNHMAYVQESNKRKEEERKDDVRECHLKPRRKSNYNYERLYDRRVI